jgi:hypothetical protein
MATPTAEMQTGEIQDVEKVTDSFRESSSLVLSEDQALAKARSSPDDALPIVITYGLNDSDNPRNWPKWKKWYITIFVSLLNVFTYVGIVSPSTSTSSNERNTEPGAPEESRLEQLESRKNLGCQLKLPHCACRSMFWVTLSAQCSSPRYRNILAVSRYTLCRGSFCSSSSFLLHLLPTLEPFWSAGSSQDVLEGLR